MRILCKNHIFSTKNNRVFVILPVEISEWILGFCKDGPTPPSHSQKGANVESSRAPYQSAFSQEDLHEWSPLVFNQQQLITVTDFTNHQEAK